MITLRPLTSHDLQDFIAWAMDDAVTRYLVWETYRSPEQAKKFFETFVPNHPCLLAIDLGGKAIGSISLDFYAGAYAHRANLGYVLAREYWGHGYATEATRLILKKGFEELALTKIESAANVGNIGSQRVLLKNGFCQEGLARSAFYKRGRYEDAYLYGLLKQEWEENLNF